MLINAYITTKTPDDCLVKCLTCITRKRHEEKLPIRVVSIYVCVEHVKVVSWDFGDVPRLVRYIKALRSVVEPNVYYTPL